MRSISLAIAFLLATSQCHALEITQLDSDAANNTIDRSSTSTKEAPGTAIHQPATPEGQAPVVNNHQPHPRLAITLAGGGAKGAAHIGVLKALESQGLRPEFVSGSSIGAVIGALYASGLSASQIEQLALNGELQKAFFPVSIKLKTITWVPTYAFKRLIGMKPPIGLYSGKKIAKFVNAYAPVASKNIEDMPIPFAAIAVDLEDSKPLWITKGNIGAAVRASSSLPGFYRPVETDKRTMVDGGVRSVLPTELSQASGAPVVVASRLHSKLEVEPKKKMRTLTGFTTRIADIFMAEIESRALSKADVIIEPDLQKIDMDELTNAKIAQAIKAGELATLKQIPQIKEQLLKSTGTASLQTPPTL